VQVIEVIHPGLAGVSKKDLKEKLASMYKVHACTDALCGGERCPLGPLCLRTLQ